jgi:hypothetical protein
MVPPYVLAKYCKEPPVVTLWQAERVTEDVSRNWGLS